MIDMGSGTPEQVVLGYIRKKSEQTIEQASKQYACMVSALVPALTSLNDSVWPEF